VARAGAVGSVGLTLAAGVAAGAGAGTGAGTALTSFAFSASAAAVFLASAFCISLDFAGGTLALELSTAGAGWATASATSGTDGAAAGVLAGGAGAGTSTASSGADAFGSEGCRPVAVGTGATGASATTLSCAADADTAGMWTSSAKESLLALAWSGTGSLCCLRSSTTAGAMLSDCALAACEAAAFLASAFCISLDLATGTFDFGASTEEAAADAVAGTAGGSFKLGFSSSARVTGAAGRGSESSDFSCNVESATPGACRGMELSTRTGGDGGIPEGVTADGTGGDISGESSSSAWTRSVEACRTTS
jgi:hypothetical protein